jgi:hypothetical protein
MNDSAASYVAAIKACRLLGLLRAEWWPQEEDDFDLVAAAALAKLPRSAVETLGRRCGVGT